MYDRVARATELALEQQERFDSFKKMYTVDDPTTDVIRKFYGSHFEVNQAFLIMDHLAQAHKEKTSTPK